MGSVYQAGTLSGNPLAMAAGIATLDALTPSVHRAMVDQTSRLVNGLSAVAKNKGVPFSAGHTGSMWGFFFLGRNPRNFGEAKAADVALFKRFFHAARERGVYLAPSPFEAAFMSSAHGAHEVDETLDRLDQALTAALA